jgi:hypothetical protein
MVRLAESITGEATIPPDQPDPEYLTSLADARSLASFPVKTPARLPEGMNFQYAQVLSDGSRQTVILHYTDGNQDLSIRQAAGAPDSLQALELQAETYRQVTVHDRPALISQGYFDQGGWKEIPDGGDGSASLTWIEDGIVLTVGGFNGYPSAIWLEIAEGVQ